MDNVTERRNWQRLRLAIPVFLRGTDDDGKPFLDFTMALNLSVGGALIVSRHPLSRSSMLSLEMPTCPMPNLPQTQASSRVKKVRVVRAEDKDAYNLYALRFNQPLI